MSSQHSTQFFWSDWAGDQAVRRLSPAERGVWIDLICLAAVGSPTGYVCDERGNPLSYEEIGRFTNASSTEVESLIAGILEKGAASRDRTGRLFNRRMVRAAEKAALKRAAGKLGGGQTRQVWKQLRQQALSNSALANDRAFAVAPRSPPIQSNQEITTTVSVETSGSLATAPLDGALRSPLKKLSETPLASPELVASLAKKGALQ